jgi:ATP-binding cassette subfamily F protein 2
LDLDACVWLEEELRNYKRILVMVSHSQDFLNGVCTNIVHLTKKKLFVYGVSEMKEGFCWDREKNILG